MTTHRSLRASVLALSATVIFAACGEPFGFTGGGGSAGTTGGAGGASTTSTSTTSTGGGKGGAGGATSSSSTTTSTGGTTSTSTGGGGGTTSTTTSSSGSGGGCDATDADGDGVTGCQGDCDNNDKSVFPGHPEICGDGKDNDCNGTIDDFCVGLGTFVSNPTDGGSDTNPGTPDKPVATIAKGIANAQAIKAAGGNGSMVFVSAGHYPEAVTVVEGISLSGGYQPKTWQKNPAMFDTAILAQNGDGLYVPPNVTRQTSIDGFRLQGQNGAIKANSAYGAALSIDRSSPTVTNNVINGPAEGQGIRSFGVIVLGPSNDPKGGLIAGNRITGGDAMNLTPCEASIGLLFAAIAAPLVFPGATAEVNRNKIHSGSCKNSYGVVAVAHADQTTLFDNDINTGTAGTGDAWGIVVSGNTLNAELVVDRNRINLDQTLAVGCNVLSSSALNWCGGINSTSAKLRAVNNVIMGVKAVRSTALWLHNPEQPGLPPAIINSNFLDGAGANNIGTQSAAIAISLEQGTDGTVGRIRNNVLAGGMATVRFGIYEDSTLGKQCHPEALENNDFFLALVGGGDAFYRFWDGSTATKHVTMSPINSLNNSQNNFSGDCQFDSTYHIQSGGSLCVDSGTATEAPKLDIDGDTRPQGGKYDVGPDER